MTKVNKQEGDGFAAPKSMTAWAVEINGKISPYDVVRTREVAREIRREWAGIGPHNKVHVRKVQVQVVDGR